MIDKKVLAEMRLRTCAVGVLRVPTDEFLRDPGVPSFKILGTGFMVGPATIVTNRHVLMQIDSYVVRENLSKDRRFLAFLRPDGQRIAQSFHQIERIWLLKEPVSLDIGFATFHAESADATRYITPVQIPSAFTGEVGDPVAVFGYAFAENLLRREAGDQDRIYRFGPILQQGYISAISPYEHAPITDRLLLDVRTARGMSGAPVFDPHSGAVVAIHSSGIDDTVAFGIPICAPLIADLLAVCPGLVPGGNVSGSSSPVRNVGHGS